MRFPALLRHPAFWLIVQPLVLVVVVTAMGLMAVRTEPDSSSYLEADLSSWRAALSAKRTLGYPLLLQAVRTFSPSLAAVPYVQFALHAVAVAALYVGLRRYGFSLAAALLAASTLLYSGFFLHYVGVILTDAPALSLAVLAVACLAAVAAGGGAAAWIGATAFVFLAYQFRPAYLFLVPLTPLVGLALAWLRPAGAERPAWLRVGVGLSLATLAPLLFFCAFRWAMVGHLGLVSFGGISAAGIASQMLTPEIAAELPPDVQPLARAILQRQRAAPDWTRPEGYYDIFRNYDPVLYGVAIPAAEELYGGDDVLINQRLGKMARQVFLARPGAYVRWLLPAAKHGVTQLFEYSFLDRPGLTLLPLLALCQLVLYARWRNGDLDRSARRSDCFFEYHATLLIALAFAAAKLGLVILVEAPIHRYVAPAAIFLPTWLAVALVDRAQRLALLRCSEEEVG